MKRYIAIPMVMLLALAVSSCSSPYDKYSVGDPILSGQMLYIPVVQEKGRYKHEIGPCPRPQRIPKSSTHYLLVYELTLPVGTNSCLPTVQILHDGPPGSSPPPNKIPKGVSAQNSGVYPFKSLLHSKEELAALKHSGFILADADWVVPNDTGGKKVFGSPLGNHGIQIYSFDTGTLFSCPLEFGQMVWDHAVDRIMLCGDSRVAAFVSGIPETVTIWRYTQNTTNTWRLACPVKEDFERSRQAQNK
jgi:hypothetical protein